MGGGGGEGERENLSATTKYGVGAYTEKPAWRTIGLLKWWALTRRRTLAWDNTLPVPSVTACPEVSTLSDMESSDTLHPHG